MLRGHCNIIVNKLVRLPRPKSKRIIDTLTPATLKLSNYRLVSNLPFLTKVIEKVVASRLNLHLEQHDLEDEYQRRQ